MGKFIIWVTKERVQDNWNDGEVDEHETIFYGECANSRGDSNLKTAFENAFYKYCQEKDTSKLEVDEFGEVCFTRLENEDHEPPTEEEMKDWKDGKIDLYNATYSFIGEYREEVDLAHELKYGHL